MDIEAIQGHGVNPDVTAQSGGHGYCGLTINFQISVEINRKNGKRLFLSRRMLKANNSPLLDGPIETIKQLNVCR